MLCMRICRGRRYYDRATGEPIIHILLTTRHYLANNTVIPATQKTPTLLLLHAAAHGCGSLPHTTKRSLCVAAAGFCGACWKRYFSSQGSTFD